ncbi:MAG: cbb3-type cytochrome c oxidase subunit II [Burkholderiales bacterium]|nr:cbb3-type cytochrome c oxidase subunit II [Burkholderiales bacterium]
MNNAIKLITGAMVTLAFSVAVLVVLPYLQVAAAPPVPGLKPYTSAELRGRGVYIAQGCLYCHTQQPRPRAMGPDTARGWGRPTVAGDYAYDAPVLLGTMRTGPDLMNIGVRQPSADWQLGHLYEPRAYVPGSIMPAFPYLFEVKDKADESETALNLPPGLVPAGKVVVPRPEAQDLVKYLLSLDRSYPVPTDGGTPPS